MPIFALPSALAGLAAAAGLVAIYWLRNRSRRQVVSSLMLWADQKRPHRGGRIVQRMQTPLLFLLELGAIVLLVLAAAGPRLPAAGSRGIIIVLDDSFSMGAGGKNSPRSRAAKAIVEMLRRDKYVGRFILAGHKPQLLGRAARSPEQAQAILEQWRCMAGDAAIQEAMALAGELTGHSGRIMVVSDHRPAVDLQRGRIEWHSFGRPRANFAFVNAACADHDGRQRVLLEIANLSDSDTSTVLTIQGGGLGRPQRQRLRPGPKKTSQVIFQLPSTGAPLKASISDDALQFDNAVTLLPQPARPIRVAVRLSDQKLRAIVQRALDATELAEQAGRSPQLLITDSPAAPPATHDQPWRLELLTGDSDDHVAAYAGPFVLDRSHPLAEGLSLEGLVWSADPNRQPPGRPVIMAGNVVLLADTERFDGRHDLRMQFRPEMSTLQGSPGWPTLFHNLLRWRASALPGMARQNVRLGRQASAVLPVGVTHVKLTAPGAKARTVAVHERRLTVEADRPGLYQIAVAEGPTYGFACNAISREESDLTGAAAGVWGSWDESGAFGREYVSIMFIPALLAVAALVAHLVLMGRAGGGTKP